MARVQISSWRATYSGIVPKTYLDAMDHDEYEGRWLRWLGEPPDGRVFYVAEDEDAGVVGFASCGPGKEPPREDLDGELYTVYLAPGYGGRGTGGRLIRAVAAGLIEGGFGCMYCWVMVGNRNARHFYERLGGREVGDHTFELHGARIAEVAYVWDDLRALSGDP